MITIEYAAKINEREVLELYTNVEEKFFNEVLLILLRCGYLIKSVSSLKE